MHGKMVQKSPANDRASGKGKAWLGGLEWPGWAVVAAPAPHVPQREHRTTPSEPVERVVAALQTRHQTRGGGGAGAAGRRISDSGLPWEIPPSS